MFRLVILMTFLLNIYAEEPSYIEQRRQMLKDQKIVLYPRPEKSNLIDFYYGPQKPRPTDFPLIINEEDLCTKHGKVFLFVNVRTHYAHLGRRKVFREIFRLYNEQNSLLRVVHAFLFGRARNETINKLIKEESLLHGDILQEGYIEHYANLTLKTLQAWKWSLKYCPITEYVMVMNDEIFLDLIKIIPFLFKDHVSSKTDDHFALCHRIGNYGVSHLKYPYFKDMAPDYLYQGRIYPYYCHGYGYIAHITVINKLYYASHTNTYFMPDDCWLGVLTEKLRLKMTNHIYHYATKANVLNIFSKPDYRSSPVMMGITDYAKNKGHEASIMGNLLSIVKKHYKDLYVTKVKGTTKPYHREKHIENLYENNRKRFKFVFLWLIFFLGMIFILMKLAQRVLKLLYKKCGFV